MEIWKNLTDYPELFEVSNTGKIRSKKRKKELKQYFHKHGYYHVASKIGGRKGKSVCFKIHREVAKAFLANPLVLPVVNHKDGVKTNNNLSNLEWATYSDNSKHAFKTGLLKTPNQKDRRRLTEKDALFVRANYKPRDKEFGCRALAKKYSVTHRVISEIISNKSYKMEA